MLVGKCHRSRHGKEMMGVVKGSRVQKVVVRIDNKDFSSFKGHCYNDGLCIYEWKLYNGGFGMAFKDFCGEKEEGGKLSFDFLAGKRWALWGAHAAV